MAKHSTLTEKILFLSIGVAIIILPMTTVSLEPNSKPFPDFLFCFIFMFLIKNPRKVSITSILFLCLLADFLWYRPVGLTTLTFILSSELLRWYLIGKERVNLIEELIYISLIFIFMTAFQEIIKFFTLIPSMTISDLMTYTLFTLLLYFLTALVMKISKSSSPK